MASAGAARRGRSDEGHEVDQGRLQPRGVACAARFAGELPVLLATLHKTKRIRVRMMRLDRGKQMEDTGGTERLERAGMESKTAAVCRTPASNRSGLGARRRGKSRGNGGGDQGLLIGTKKGRNRCVNGPHS